MTLINPSGGGLETRIVWVVPNFGSAAAASQGDFAGIPLSASSTQAAFGNAFFPSDMSELVSAHVYFIPNQLGSGAAIVMNLATDFGAPNEPYNQHSDSLGQTTVPVVAGEIKEVDFSAALTAFAPGDYVGLDMTRLGGDGADTFTAIVTVIGFKLVFR